ncbi:hypothetical protein RQP46_003911 [Phenoliferia psychrophenolica]
MTVDLNTQDQGTRLPVELLALVEHIRMTSSDLSAYGSSAYALFTTTLSSLPASPTRAATLAAALLRLSNEKILAYDYKDVPKYWRRMYTDATVLGVISRMLEGGGGSDAVRELDMALIVAGSPGADRTSLILKLIRILQQSIPSPPARERAIKRARISALPPPYLTNPIPRLSSPPPLHLLPPHPFILPAHCADWAASARWSSPAYLLAKAGPSRVVPVEVGRNYTEDGWGQRIIPFEEFLDSLERGGETLYLAQHDLFRQIPELRDDVEIPDLVYAAPDPPENYPTYKPPDSEDGYVLNAWLGPAGTVSPAHTDPYFNCYAQVVGSKWIWVAPPEISPSMTTFGVVPPPSPSPSHSSSSSPPKEEPDSTTSIYMSNTARIDVTDPPDSSQVARFPDFVRDVVPISQQAVLEEGDLLFMPPG